MVTEDELYRSSTQYRLWNFTTDRLAALRRKTNKLAKEQARKAIKRRREIARYTSPTANNEDKAPNSENGDAENHQNGSLSANIEDDIDFLTVQEEKLLVDWYCTQLLNMVQHLENSPFPTQVVATAVQFIKRFYLFNSVLSYNPKQIMTTALFLATKTESTHMTAERFVKWLNPIKGLGDLTTEEVLAPEYTFAQGLRYTYDVRHPHRALKGAFLELQLLVNYARGDRLPESWRPENTVSSKEPKGWDTQRHLMQVYGPPTKFAARVERAYQRAREILGSKALLSDAYFLFTPSQIMFAALFMADVDIAKDLLRIRVTLPKPGPVTTESTANRPGLGAVLAEVEACAKILDAVNTEELMNDARRVAKKLEGCRNPDKIDLVGLNKSKKRDASEDGKLDESLAKKRRLQREKAEKEGEDLFGPKLVQPS